MYSQETFHFLIENKLADSKEFFAANKQRFEQHVLAPLAETVAILTPAMLKIDEQFIVEPKVDKTISRIYRDTRFSADKSKYRDTMWITFQKNRKLFEGDCAYFFEISPRVIRYGIGYYMADAKSMENMRALIDGGDKAFMKALDAQTRTGFDVEGEVYKKNRYFGGIEGAANWYNRKSVYLCKSLTDFSPLYDGSLHQTLIRDFTDVKAVYEFFNNIEAMKKPSNSL